MRVNTEEERPAVRSSAELHQFLELLEEVYSEQTLSPAELQERVNKALVKALSYEGTTSIRQAGNLEKDSPEYRSLVEYKG